MNDGISHPIMVGLLLKAGYLGTSISGVILSRLSHIVGFGKRVDTMAGAEILEDLV